MREHTGHKSQNPRNIKPSLNCRPVLDGNLLTIGAVNSNMLQNA